MRSIFLRVVLVATASALPSPVEQTEAPLLPGLPRPQALQGHDDEQYPIYLAGLSDGVFEKRYKVLGTMQVWQAARPPHCTHARVSSQQPRSRSLLAAHAVCVCVVYVCML